MTFIQIGKVKKTSKGFTFSIGENRYFLNPNSLQVFRMEFSENPSEPKQDKPVSLTMPPTKDIPQHKLGTCQDCGKKVKKNRFGKFYKYCYKCNEKRKNEG